MKRRVTRKINTGRVVIGGNAPISVQSMTKTDTHDVKGTLKQIKQLEKAGCELVRVAVPDKEAAMLLGEIRRKSCVPLVADIHFDYRLALESIRQGVDKIRLNPGNIGGLSQVELVVKAAKKAGIPIRIGINSGSLEKSLIIKDKAEAMVHSAVKYIKYFEKLDFFNIVVSLKSTDVNTTIKAYNMLSKKTSYPLHLGITEAGTKFPGTVKSSVALGALLSAGIGDTIRVSLTASPVEEVKAGFEILKALKLRQYGPEIISCPTCGRCRVDIITIVKQLQEKLEGMSNDYSKLPPVKVAVMGCAVNGPGEAKDADIGIAAGKGSGTLFRKGKIIRKLKEKDFVKTLLIEIRKMKTP